MINNTMNVPYRPNIRWEKAALGFGIAGFILGVTATVLYMKEKNRQDAENRQEPEHSHEPYNPRASSHQRESAEAHEMPSTAIRGTSPVRTPEGGAQPHKPKTPETVEHRQPALAPAAPKEAVIISHPAVKERLSRPAEPEAGVVGVVKVVEVVEVVEAVAPVQEAEAMEAQTEPSDAFPLRLGSKGPHVERLQVWLMRNFGHFGKVTGELDQPTLERMQKYMKKSEVDQETYTRLGMEKPVHKQPFAH